MATQGYQLKPSQVLNTLLPALVLIIVLLFNSLAISQEPSLEIEAPDNWYQVEVILFTQNGNIGGEAPPHKYQLDFPQNWLTLVDPNMPLEQDGFPLAEGSLLYPSNLENSERIIPLTVVADPLIADQELLGADSTGVDISANAVPVIETEEPYTPQYETPFVLLDKEYRDLNDSAAAMDRRQYNVVFHEAWRFAADDNAADPWVIIKAGQRFEDRFQLEGSLRFYKSRFLHFESDLWLLQFANVSPEKPSTLINLPEFPATPESAEDKFNIGYLLPESTGTADIDKPDFLTSAFEERTLETSEHSTEANPLVSLADDLDIDSTSYSEVIDSKPAQKYPIETVWVLKQSKRIESQAIYYIDHPEMGIMVTIKPFIPELLNPLEKTLEPQGTEVAQDAIASPLGQ